MIEIRGQQATDWEDLYAIRKAMPGALPYIRPEWVRDELARPHDQAWPLVAVALLPEGPRVVARVNLELGGRRRGHCAWLTLERHPDLGQEAGRQLLVEAVATAEKWWNRRRLEVSLPASDTPTIALYQSLGFGQEARLQQSLRVAGELVDELVLARLSGDAARRSEPVPGPPAQSPAPVPSSQRPALCIRGGSVDDWEAMHTIWLQPSVVWGTMGLPYASADWDRQRVQERQPPRFWPLVAEVDGRVVAVSGLTRHEHNRSHAAHVGMMVHDDYQGMGVGSVLMEAVLDLAVNWLGLVRLQLEVYPENARAIRLYEKYGFEAEGVYRAYAYRDGHYADTLVMGRLGG
jgi:putative acetyltransferase